MKKNQKINKEIDFKEYLAKQLKNPKFKKYYNKYGKQLEIAYQILQMRKKRKLSQAELARRIKTTQSNIARIESGQQNCSITLIAEIAVALKYEFKPQFIAK